ncbi:peptide N-acetyl-beta-D-glucosaminyl asparaginase amidase A-domain-containing protein [Leptodontidium sp. 2 PMI_412]|nr:peptide N-acetyl-beta-D-glucosaminyl asparaginase amidase A-domain-containing protein [Leptodontidium sp. 2 PMI_412]
MGSSSRPCFLECPSKNPLMMLFVFLIFVGLLHETFGKGEVWIRGSNESETTGLLEVFQVEAPLRKSYDGTSCKQVIMQHDFTASYGSPYVGLYSPPIGCKFTTVIFNMSITSAGINYDRLGLLFLGDIEVWRTTTGMPVRTGIFYNFLKDVTVFNALLRTEQKVIMQLDNIYNDVFTGNFNVTVTALYYDDDETFTPADTILPISAKLSSANQSSVLSLPDGNASVSATFPRNVERAVVSILASGNGAEEFWFTNVPTEYEKTFNNSAIYGYSPFREVQLLIDGKLAGASWPFPTVFTGGISPGLWVPIVGVDTYDLPNFEIDIGPWLGLLCDGKSHTFELKVVGYDSKTTLGTVGSNWWVSGSIFLWLDGAGDQTTGSAIQSSTPAPKFDFTPIVTISSGLNSTLWVKLTAERTLSHTSTITTSSGSQTLTWSQSLGYVNIQNFTAKGYNETLYQLASGASTFSSLDDDKSEIKNSFSYPLSFAQDYVIPVDPTSINSTLVAELDRSKLSYSISILSHLTSPTIFQSPALLATRQNGSCVYFWNNTYYQFAGAIDPADGTIGATEQWFSFMGPLTSGELDACGRHVKAVDGYEPVLVLDETFEKEIEVPETVSLVAEKEGL